MNTQVTTCLCAVVLITMLMTGCGNKGPLYLPEQGSESETATETSDDSENRR